MVRPRNQFLLIALAVESFLVPVAIIAGAITGHPPLSGHYLEDWRLHLTAAGQGMLAALPLLLFLLLIDRIPLRSLVELQRIVQQQLLPHIRLASAWELALISILAGLGEELLFRGWLQGWLSTFFPESSILIAIVLAAVVFGACHWLNNTYFVIATLAGIYFGLLLVWTESLAAPITAHAAYDFGAFLYLRWRPADETNFQEESFDELY